MPTHDRIEIDPNIMLGKPAIRVSWIPVELVVRKFVECADEKALLHAYPGLTLGDIRTALCDAVDSLAHEEVLLRAAG